MQPDRHGKGQFNALVLASLLLHLAVLLALDIGQHRSAIAPGAAKAMVVDYLVSPREGAAGLSAPASVGATSTAPAGANTVVQVREMRPVPRREAQAQAAPAHPMTTGTRRPVSPTLTGPAEATRAAGATVPAQSARTLRQAAPAASAASAGAAWGLAPQVPVPLQPAPAGPAGTAIASGTGAGAGVGAGTASGTASGAASGTASGTASGAGRTGISKSLAPAGSPGSARSGQVRRGSYEGVLKGLIEAHKEYPLAARKSGREGSCQRRFVLGRDGGLRKVESVSSCGHPFLDSAATRAITSVGKFPPFPDEFPGAEESFTITMTFTLSGR